MSQNLEFLILSNKNKVTLAPVITEIKSCLCSYTKKVVSELAINAVMQY